MYIFDSYNGVTFESIGQTDWDVENDGLHSS